MKIEEAIDRLRQMPPMPIGHEQAIQLGIEALERIQALREELQDFPELTDLLPSEK